MSVMNKKDAAKGIAAGKVIGAAGGIVAAAVFAMIAASKERKRKLKEGQSASGT